MKINCITMMRRKTLCENDVSFNGGTSRILGYVIIETSEGIIIPDISIRQDVNALEDVRVVFPFPNRSDSQQHHVLFASEDAQKEITMKILTEFNKVLEKEFSEK